MIRSPPPPPSTTARRRRRSLSPPSSPPGSLSPPNSPSPTPTSSKKGKKKLKVQDAKLLSSLNTQLFLVTQPDAADKGEECEIEDEDEDEYEDEDEDEEEEEEEESEPTSIFICEPAANLRLLSSRTPPSLDRQPLHSQKGGAQARRRVFPYLLHAAAAGSSLGSSFARSGSPPQVQVRRWRRSLVCESASHLIRKKGKKGQDSKLLDSVNTQFFLVTQPVARRRCQVPQGAKSDSESQVRHYFITQPDPSRPHSIQTIPPALDSNDLSRST